MVFFTCDRCGEALKKNQVEKHSYRCKFPTYSCIDCSKVFTSTSYSEHIRCITEDQKYGGKNYVAKENKGEIKQNRWIEQVERAISAVRDPILKKLLQQIQGYSNIPRKETKFINFLQNSTHIRDRDLCVQAWNCINEEAKKMIRDEAAKTSSSLCAAISADDKAESLKEQNGDVSDNTVVTAANNESIDVSNNIKGQSSYDEKDFNRVKAMGKFKWRKAIKRVLENTSNGQMSVKKLRKVVFEMHKETNENDFAEMDKQQMKQVFAQKLEASGVIVQNKIARLPAS